MAVIAASHRVLDSHGRFEVSSSAMFNLPYFGEDYVFAFLVFYRMNYNMLCDKRYPTDDACRDKLIYDVLNIKHRVNPLVVITRGSQIRVVMKLLRF